MAQNHDQIRQGKLDNKFCSSWWYFCICISIFISRIWQLVPSEREKIYLIAIMLDRVRFWLPRNDFFFIQTSKFFIVYKSLDNNPNFSNNQLANKCSKEIMLNILRNEKYFFRFAFLSAVWSQFCQNSIDIRKIVATIY